jgi:hypothetical protein
LFSPSIEADPVGGLYDHRTRYVVAQRSLSCTKQPPVCRTEITVDMQPLGHWWGPHRGVDTARAVSHGSALLGYVEAREKIYIPAYISVIEREKMHEKMVELANFAMHHKVVLLDNFTNADVTDEATPLSHAALVRQYLKEHEDDLLDNAL